MPDESRDESPEADAAGTRTEGDAAADGRERDRDAALDAAAEDDTVSDSQKCPECDEPVHNLRATCPNCGYEYSDSDRDDPEAGAEFVAGTEIDERDGAGPPTG
ncbi:MAG: hypothetical protein ABR575_02070 [Actinomycetota bacterium]